MSMLVEAVDAGLTECMGIDRSVVLENGSEAAKSRRNVVRLMGSVINTVHGEWDNVEGADKADFDLATLLTLDSANVDQLVAGEIWQQVSKTTRRLDSKLDSAEMSKRAKKRVKIEEGKLKEWYLEQTTEAIGGELDKLRQEDSFKGTENDFENLIAGVMTGCGKPVFDREIVCSVTK